MRELAMGTAGDVTDRGKSQGKGPEAGTCLECSRGHCMRLSEGKGGR